MWDKRHRYEVGDLTHLGIPFGILNKLRRHRRALMRLTSNTIPCRML
jgi:hypothetical protein